MATQYDTVPAHAAFTPDELTALGLFYAGVRARELRARFALDPWALLQRHRQLPPAEYGQVTELAVRAAADAQKAAAAGSGA